MANFTTEMIEKAKGAKTAHELLELAKAEGINITADEAAHPLPSLRQIPHSSKTRTARLYTRSTKQICIASFRQTLMLPGKQARIT